MPVRPLTLLLAALVLGGLLSLPGSCPSSAGHPREIAAAAPDGPPCASADTQPAIEQATATGPGLPYLGTPTEQPFVAVSTYRLTRPVARPPPDPPRQAALCVFRI